jgi:hypothetical protein
VVAVRYGMSSTCPAWRVFDVNPLSSLMAATVVLKAPAMPYSVSPRLTV